MSKYNESFLKNRGDTIVEVLFAMAIIAALLAGGYTVARSSLIAERRAQERGEALQLAQSQLESLKNYASSTQITTPPPFCMYNNSTVATSSTTCQFDAAGNTPTGGELPYSLSIKYPTDGQANTYTIEATWNDVGGNGQDSLILYYNLYTQ